MTRRARRFDAPIITDEVVAKGDMNLIGTTATEARELPLEERASILDGGTLGEVAMTMIRTHGRLVSEETVPVRVSEYDLTRLTSADRTPNLEAYRRIIEGSVGSISLSYLCYDGVNDAEGLEFEELLLARPPVVKAIYVRYGSFYLHDASPGLVGEVALTGERHRFKTLKQLGSRVATVLNALREEGDYADSIAALRASRRWSS